jgi:alkylation response protein AidB-like acyl-CoA dehydrogenase
MDLSLNTEQEMFKATAKDFISNECPIAFVRDMDELGDGFPRELWQKLCGLGWAGMGIPEEYGGSGRSNTDLGVLFEELGRGLLPSPLFSSAVLSALIIMEGGSEEQKRALLPAIASGQRILTLAFTEPDYGWGPDDVRMAAGPSANGFVLRGTKLFVHDAHIADTIIVAARSRLATDMARGISLFLVDAKAAGLRSRVVSGWTGERQIELTFDDVKVGPEALIGPAEEGWPILRRAFQPATAVLCAFMAGGTQAVYDMTREYSQTRIAFGVPIGTFQRVQDHVIDALTDADSAKWTAFEALWQLDENMADAPVGVSTAKSVASLGFPRACDAAHHVHAGIGADLEYGLTQYTKRARTLQHYLGDHVYHKARMARLLSMAG